MINREAMISAGWTPPAGDPQYEAWRPALAIYQELQDGPVPATPLDRVDREIIDVLRAVARVMPPLSVVGALPFPGRTVAQTDEDK